MRTTMFLVSLALVGCSSTSTPPAATADAGSDAGTCTFTTNAFPIDGDGPDGQIHAIGAWDGARTFVAYNRPKTSSSSFDVYLTALRCDGKPAFAPVRVSEDDDNDVDPALVVLADRVLVAWSANLSAGDPNLYLRLRVYDKTGKALGPARNFAGPRNGADNVHNTWLPSLAPLGGGAALVGAWGIAEAPAFQAFGARLDAQGVTQGDAFELGFDAATTQTQPDVSGDGASAWAAWLVEPNTGTGSTIATAHVPSSGAPVAGPSVVDAASPSISMRGTRAWVAGSRASGSVLLLRADQSAPPIELATQGALPAVAAADVGGAFVAYRDGASGRTVVAVRFDETGAVVRERDLGVAKAAPYPLRLVRISEDVYFVAYQSGTSPSLRAEGRYVDFSAP